MALKSPHRIVDKNGKHTTVHKRDDASSTGSKRVVGLKPPTPQFSRFDNSGIHWSKAANPRLLSLAKDSAMRFNPHMDLDELYDESPAAIEVTFGSRMGSLTLGLVDQEAFSLFNHGYCGLLALSMHDKTDLPFVVFTAETDDDGWSGHAALLVDEDTILDINGAHSIHDVAKDFAELDGTYEVMDRASFTALIAKEKYRDDPYQFVDELEQLVLDDFAEMIVKRNLEIGY